MMRASVSSTASASTSSEEVSGTETGESPLVRANTGIMPNDGSGVHNASPGSAKARMAESSTSSEPHPHAIMSGDTRRTQPASRRGKARTPPDIE